jgi:hypothetical protein
VTNRQLARIHAALRVRLRLRQQDVAAAAHLGHWKVGVLEAGELDELKVGEMRALFEALGASLQLTVFRRGADLERMLDEAHARLLGAVVALLERLGWVVRIEVTFSVRGERGSIDILAWHAAELALLVIEIKSELPGIDPLLRPLDVKVRLATQIAREQFGWNAATVSRVVVLPEDRTARRQVARHAGVLRTTMPSRSRDVRRWLRRPLGALAGIWFLSVDDSANTARNPSAIRRVQRPVSRTSRPAHAKDWLDKRVIDPHKVGSGDN